MEMTGNYIEDYFPGDLYILENSVMHHFFSSDKNISLLISAYEEEGIANKRHLDEAFKEHFYKVKLFNYTTKLIRFYTIEMKERYSRFHKRNLFILDDFTTEEDESVGLIDLTTDENIHTPEDKLENHLGLLDCTTDKNLYKALLSLSTKQLKVLNLLYAEGLGNKEIADVFGDSDQNISRIHKRAIKSLKNKLEVAS
ncbi:RNA polymerase sigma factor (sigma-70 family) [Virgibacillus natechei]|uniref:RNA polymerase sigma factor (Sigma-70 family) n=1 Tax=Virgibacillus natechei TaxID=1216297 RepID=A0ABS4IH90_9BACI|nr:sigma factor-like helix-turn-helix DNA-binding protein [Virgibacillus natechei]MBP1970312.1 RNA polymerase sigma factor (sigma-70 family) [Virgibacillus natechei]UZD13140.1 sigma-70 family RNA polymerase sigma factor [Virgibacillus natechei]